MAIFIFFKPIVDMFYSLAILDYIMMFFASMMFLVSLKKMTRMYLIDLIVLFFMFLMLFTLIRSGKGFNHFVKMESGFMLYFIGRTHLKDTIKVEKALVYSSYIVVITNVVLMIAGVGYILWGNALTFKGLYYYKTDFSVAMIYALVAFTYFGSFSKTILIEWIVIGYMILRSNTRAAMLIYILLFGLWLLFIREKRTGKVLKINMNYLIYLLAGIVVSIWLVSLLFKLPFFEKYSYISFNINKFADFLNSSNTQGRNVIWANILQSFSNSNLFEKTFGIDFVSDLWNGFDAHNAYLKILYSTGVIGLLLFLLFEILYISKLNNIQNRSLFYYCLSIFLTFAIQSVSQSSIDFTQMTWIYLWFAGVAVSESYSGIVNKSIQAKKIEKEITRTKEEKNKNLN